MNKKILSVIICVFMHVFVHAQILDSDNGAYFYTIKANTQFL